MRQDSDLPAIRQAPELLERRGQPRTTPLQYHYRTYGLTLGSQFPLPELQDAPPLPVPDAEIIASPLTPALEGAMSTAPWLQYAEDRCQFSLEGVARYRIEQGRRILVDRRSLQEPSAGTPEEDLRLYLLGTALGALLHQRDWLPLHLSALDTPSGVWGFTGQSGAGKSTLAAWLHYRQGWPLVSDDVGVIRPGEALPFLYPGPPRLKLWKDALNSLGIDHQGLVTDQTRTDKYHLVRHGGFQAAARPLRHLVMLERGDQGTPVSLESLEGLEAFKAVMATVYRPEWGLAFNGPARLLEHASGLARHIQVYRYRRPWSLDGMERSLEPLLKRIDHGEGT